MLKKSIIICLLLSVSACSSPASSASSVSNTPSSSESVSKADIETTMEDYKDTLDYLVKIPMELTLLVSYLSSSSPKASQVESIYEEIVDYGQLVEAACRLLPSELDDFKSDQEQAVDLYIKAAQTYIEACMEDSNVEMNVAVKKAKDYEDLAGEYFNKAMDFAKQYISGNDSD